MAKPVARIVALQAALGLGLVLVVGRAGYLQLVEGGEYRRQASRQRTEQVELPARRGTIYDRNGTPLAVSQPKYHVTLALNEVRDTALLISRASARLRIRADSLRRSFRRGTPRYPYFDGPFSEAEVGPLRGMKGVHLTSVYRRGYPSNDLARPVIGAVSGDSGRGRSGIERTLDSVLAGTPGLTVNLRDPRGQRFESPDRLIREPVPGHDVVLTIDAELQEIAENALARAIDTLRAEGGDVVFYDPRNGELLALASLGASGAAPASTAFTTPFEPGSTAKPFTAAALLALGRVRDGQTVSGENGAWTFATSGRATRTIKDTHVQKLPMTLAHVIQVSSNIGIAKFSRELRWEEQYEML
ncbi:MAG TPA: penicillin-binding transpeptidase domain-containing protein, partial [Gemmatimonadales bacterium]